MKLRPVLIASVVGVAAFSAPLAGQGTFPSKAPAPAPLAPVRFPPFVEQLLPNGMTLLVVENHAEPMLSATLSFSAGATRDPAGKEGLAELTSTLLTKGTTDRSADQISALIEGVGGSLSASAGKDFFSVSFDVLSDHADVALGLLREVVRQPSFPAAELEIARKQALSSLQLELSQPSSVASRFFLRDIYGANAYGRSTSEASYDAIIRDDVAHWAATYLRPAGALLVMAGDVTPAQARDWAAKAFGDWRGAPPAPARPVPVTVHAATQILLVNRPGSVQANIVLGNTTFGPTDSGYYAARVVTQALGGGADSRLFEILREQKGWTYGSYAGLVRQLHLGYWRATFEGRTAVVDSALREMLHQVDLLRTVPIPDSELTNVKGFLVGSFPLTIETSSQVAGAVANAKLLGLGNSYVRLYRERLSAVTPAQARAAAQRTYHRSGLTIVVVGDAEALYDKLQAIAPVRMVDVDGKPMTLADLHPAASKLQLDAAQMVAHRDSFVFIVQGRPFGTQISTVRKTADSLVYDEVLSMGPLGGQHTTVVFDPASIMVRQVDQTGMMNGQPSAIHLIYANGRVKGSASIPQQGGTPKALTVDTAIAATTYDDNSLFLLLPALPLASGKTFDIGVFSAGDAALRVLSAKVGAQDTVTVPAGKFTAYRVDISGGQAPLIFYVSTTSPRRIVKIEVVGQPVSIELAQ